MKSAPSLPGKGRADRRGLGSDRGSALTEFVIVAPIFLILVFWSEFFTDVSVVKLKMLEASRYALWEMTAQRNPGTVAAEVQSRFADLSSPQDLNTVNPPSRSFPNPLFITTTIRGSWNPSGQNGGYNGGSDPLYANFSPDPYPHNFNFNNVQSYINTAVQHLMAPGQNVVQKLGFNPNRTAQIDLKAAPLHNSLFPGGDLFGIFFDSTSHLQGDSQVSTLNFSATSSALLVDTWKGWPGPQGSPNGTQDPTSDPLTTYNASGGSTAEKETVARVKSIAYLNSGFVDFFATVFDFAFSSMHMGGVLGGDKLYAWNSNGRDNQSGPIIMMPGAVPTASQPFFRGYPNQRAGDMTDSSDTPITRNVAVGGGRYVSPVGGVDRERFTVPYKINSQFWTGVGGLGTVQVNSGGGLLGIGKIMGPNRAPALQAAPPTLNTASVNPYIALYGCRDAFYMGSGRPQLEHWTDGSAYFADAYGSACAGGGGGGGNGWGMGP